MRIHKRSPKAPTRPQYDHWLLSLWTAISELGIAKEGRTQEEIQECIINVDETGIDRPDPKKIRVMAPPKSDAALAIARAKVDHVTLVGCIDAAGGHMPALLIHKGSNELSTAALQRTAGTPSNVAWAVSSTGYMNGKIWLQVLQFIVAQKKPTADKPILVIADNHSTRYDIAAIEWAKEHHCHVFTLPPNCTSVTQPLDISVYGPFKNYLGQDMDEKMCNGIQITRTLLPMMIINAWNKAASVQNIRSGWRAAAMSTFHNSMNSLSMTSDKFTPEDNKKPTNTSPTSSILSSSSSSAPSPVKSIEWKAPDDLKDILRPRLRVIEPTRPRM